jgi:hypothetical protein
VFQPVSRCIYLPQLQCRAWTHLQALVQARNHLCDQHMLSHYCCTVSACNCTRSHACSCPLVQRRVWTYEQRNFTQKQRVSCAHAQLTLVSARVPARTPRLSLSLTRAQHRHSRRHTHWSRQSYAHALPTQHRRLRTSVTVPARVLARFSASRACP